MADTRLASLSAPTLSDIETLAGEAYADLPAHFRALCGDIVISVEDFPSDDVLADMRAGPFDLLGLFQGVGMTEDAAVPFSTIGPSTRKPLVASSPMSWCTRSATTSACPTPTWTQSSAPPASATGAQVESPERGKLRQIQDLEHRIDPESVFTFGSDAVAVRFPPPFGREIEIHLTGPLRLRSASGRYNRLRNLHREPCT
jgi:hypothetical protein